MVFRVDKDWMFMDLSYGSPCSLQRQDLSACKFPSVPTLSTMLESEWLEKKKKSYNVQVPFFSKDVGILKNPIEK